MSVKDNILNGVNFINISRTQSRSRMEYSLEHRTQKQISAGAQGPRGAVLKKDGVNFAVFSRYAEELFLLLFDSPDGEPMDIIRMDNVSGNVRHVYVHGIKAGQLYGYKARGKYDPAQAMRFNEHKLLIDPYAKAVTGKCQNIDNLLFAYDIDAPGKDLVMDQRDNTRIVPKSIVIDDTFDWQNDLPPRIPLEELIIYEVHLKGFTAHPSSRVQYPGTYLGFIEKISYLKDLGVNAVELLPLHEFYSRDFLHKNNLSEYWGYNPIGYFAPEVSYSTRRFSGCQVEEFKTLVRELHKAGIEVILDVVYNHTGEGDELGPTVCFRGLDNSTYYALKGPPEEPYRLYKQNTTGCGNTLSLEKAPVRHLVLDSLRYWVEHMHVDAFRFDLAPVLSREKGRFRKDSHFLKAVTHDPVLSQVKMIAEPWDLKSHHYGDFPGGWLEWNDRFRNTVRKFIKGDAGQVNDLARMLTGSRELHSNHEKKPYHSVNFITCHDGFTLRDLFSYNHKHNKDNHEHNKDGSNHNDSWNCGVEGETQDVEIINLRKRMIKNALCCLAFSLGTPMMLGGDEFMRTQKGNNNAYCQDNDISWFNWEDVQKNSEILDFTKKLLAFRKQHAVFKKENFLLDKDAGPGLVPDILWFGRNLDKPCWSDPSLRILCCQFAEHKSLSEEGDYYLFFIYNADAHSHIVQLPHHAGAKWCRVIDTGFDSPGDFLDVGQEKFLEPFDRYAAKPRSTVVLLGKYDR